jgi:hypothetical protein
MLALGCRDSSRFAFRTSGQDGWGAEKARLGVLMVAGYTVMCLVVWIGDRRRLMQSRAALIS